MGQKSAVRTIATWMCDPDQMRRLDAVVSLSQRTSFVKSVLSLSEDDEIMRAAIRRSCERQGVECRIPRGSATTAINFRELTFEQRYAASVLLKSLHNTDDSGVAPGVQGHLVSSELLDRMLYVYRRYISLSSLQPVDAPVSFELFVLLRRQFVMSEIEFVRCDNCGSEHVSGKEMHSLACPICKVHNHAQRVRHRANVRHLVLTGRKVA